MNELRKTTEKLTHFVLRTGQVETVGDCYVGVCGLPKPNKDHAVVMARFARECVERFNDVVTGLENALGPDTSELAIR